MYINYDIDICTRRASSSCNVSSSFELEYSKEFPSPAT